MHTSAGSPISQQLITAQLADETVSQWVDVRGYTYLTFYLTSAGTTSSGVITIEEMAPPDMSLKPLPPQLTVAAGSFSAITTVNASTFSGTAQLAVHVAPGAYYYVRARISTVIGGTGTVSVGLVAA